MIKKLRNKAKNKKGFTLVELIVVIVIIIVLAAVMIPTVLKYVDKAAQANCKSDAATALVQLQADIADHYTTDSTAFTPTKVLGIDYEGTYTATPAANKYCCELGTVTDETEGNVTKFSYGDSKYTIEWKDGKWQTPEKQK